MDIIEIDDKQFNFDEFIEGGIAVVCDTQRERDLFIMKCFNFGLSNTDIAVLKRRGQFQSEYSYVRCTKDKFLHYGRDYKQAKAIGVDIIVKYKSDNPNINDLSLFGTEELLDEIKRRIKKYSTPKTN